MQDSLYKTQIDEIDGEIASLKISLNITTDEKRKEEIRAEIKDLQEQREELVKRWKDKNEFKEKYKAKVEDIFNHVDYNEEIEDGFLGPTGEGITHDEY